MRNKISRKSTNLDIGLQSSAGVVSHLTGLVHHFHLLHHKIQLKKSFLGSTRGSSGLWYAVKSDDGRAVEAATVFDA